MSPKLGNEEFGAGLYVQVCGEVMDCWGLMRFRHGCICG